MSFLSKITQKPDGSCREVFHTWKIIHKCPEFFYEECLNCKKRQHTRIVRHRYFMMDGYREFVNYDWLEGREINFVPKMSNIFISWR